VDQADHAKAQLSMANGTNGIHGNGHGALANGHKAIALSSSSSSSISESMFLLPPAFVAIATSMCVETLLLENTVVWNDAYRLLSRLIRTGLVLARQSFQSETFTHLLKTLDCAKYSKLSSENLILLMLRHMEDVSEYHMVAMIRAFLRNAVGANMVHETKISKAKMSSVATLSGMLGLLDLLMNYSSVNDALLRSAAKNLLTQDETFVAIRLIIAYIMGKLRDEEFRPISRSRAMQWIGVLSELFQEESPDDSRLGIVRQFISDEIKYTESMLCVKRLVDGRLLALSADREQVDGTLKPAVPNQQPPYQIEHIVF
jgi:hypothetical protein